jgi:NitT/TauT family transport system substrate-binding protein
MASDPLRATDAKRLVHMPRLTRLRSFGFGSLLVLLLAPFLAIQPAARTVAQTGATPTPLSCTPITQAATVPAADIVSPVAAVAPATGEPLRVTMGYTPVSIFAPVFLAKEKGYYAAEGLDVTLEPLPGGADMIVLTASGNFDVGIAGAGPAFWNAMAQNLPLTVVAPGHAEGLPVATPLMIATDDCTSGEIASVADLKGKKVSVNARGATEYWLSQALATGGLTLDDIDLQTLAFPDAVTALAAGAIDAAMVGEPLAAKAEQDGIAVRLATDFAVQDVQPTLIFANDTFVQENPDALTGLVTAYLKACRDLTGAGFKDPLNLAIIEQYTKVPASLIGSAVQPVYAVDGTVNVDGLRKLQTFFRERGQLDYDADLDPTTFIDDRYLRAALDQLGPYQA